MALSHTWNFFRAGGFDQVQIDNGADLLALKELDQKLWVALSCPTRGIEFDGRTLDLIDHDQDARVHANEILGAIAWTGRLLKDPDLMVKGSPGLALADIDDSHEEGHQVLASAQYILRYLGRPDAAEISLADLADIGKLVASLDFNGDGLITPLRIKDAKLRSAVEDILKYQSSVPDVNGEASINQEISDAFFAEIAAWRDWQSQGDSDPYIGFLGEATPSAAGAFHAIEDKVNDYFTR